MRTLSIVFAATAALAAVAVVAAPASAASSGTTDATFSVDGGSLDITVPVSADLGSGAAEGTVTANLGTVSVIDQRAALVGSWTTEAVSSTFVTGAGTSDETISADQVSYQANGPAVSTGNGTPIYDGGPVSIANSTPVMVKVDGAGNNSSTWDPSLFVDLPSAAVAGTYAGTITHSVA